ncbi:MULTISPECIES: cyclic nucleotide-binding domain-containing protein [unclassified Bradyrhizobium]|uniref:cyclic nucleotide-binding domain-containing protein n=1 Tax=unclassified Bradyrhizobium TaxID=2631580 RepID=UPI00070C2EA4|nr:MULTISPECIES: cyclic nucleotide-binding domain-containing protein [unclassified Bradyrhizobium]KQT21346.1 hypothetical protein ASG57_04290 [Bradyrhizobium sp. Leaf396]
MSIPTLRQLQATTPGVASSPPDVVIADTPDLLQKIYHFRYQIYVGELKFEHPDADHAQMTLNDELDECSTNFALFGDDGAVAATLRCTLLDRVPNPAPIIARLSLEPFVERFGLSAVATTSRFMFASKYRRTAAIVKLASAGFELARVAGVRFNFGDTNPIWLEYFERLGYRRYAKGLNDPVFGYHLPIVMLMRDLDYFRSARSPIARYLSHQEDDAEARKWFGEFAGQYHFLCPVGRKLESFVEQLRRLGVDSATLAAALKRVPNAWRGALVEQCNLLILQPGDLLTRYGEIDDTAFLCITGTLLQSDKESEDPPRKLGPGDWLAIDELLSPGPRRSSIVAASESIVFVLPARQLRRANSRLHGALMDALLDSAAGYCRSLPS